jgi:hypothetical protein
MQRWRYHSLIMRDLSIAETKLNAEGEKGWELVSVCMIDGNTARAFFKMPTDQVAGEVVAAVTATSGTYASTHPYPESEPLRPAA